MMQFEEFLALLQESGMEVSRVGHEEHHSWIEFGQGLHAITEVNGLSMFQGGKWCLYEIYWPPVRVDAMYDGLSSDLSESKENYSALSYSHDTLKKIKRMLT